MITFIRTLLIGLLLAIVIPSTALAQLGDPQSLADEISALQARLADLPIEQADSIEVTQIELTLGALFQTMGDHQAASRSFAQALANQREQIGLYHPELVPTYLLLLDSILNQGDLSIAAGLVDQMEWLETQGLENDDTMRVQLLKALAYWHLSAFNESIDDDAMGHLQASLEYLNKALESGEEHVLSDPEIGFATLVSSWQLERYIDTLMNNVGYGRANSSSVSLGRANVEMVEELCQRTLPRVPVTALIDSDSEMIFSTENGNSDTPLLDTEQLRPYFNRCNNTFSNEREQRSTLIEAQLEFAAPIDWLRMGDWFLMTDEISKAQEWYAKVWDAELSLSPDLLSRITQPEPLTLAGLLPQAPKLRRGYRDTRTLGLLMDIDADGRIRQVELQPGFANPLSESEYSAVTGWIESLPFRPPLDSGALEDRSGVLCHFSLARKLCLSD